ncbi:hypothetical protein HK44_007195 [Pseudomonas fluorescens HK44]|uniref:Uncharacterized protein n=1 Tax=Pseudomonas fluorescens HK44 TaxID=1042209 RepID=A0A010T9U2_PSEFL|nr:hypothetical protein [Pseudomonas fluorescens]EXF94112.1 hypothetical protein HK44_007195 [Pseudomonas fluorescens HK44]
MSVDSNSPSYRVGTKAVVIFVAKIALGLVVFAYKPWLGVLFLAAYAAYFWKEMRSEQDEEEYELEPLKLAPGKATP